MPPKKSKKTSPHKSKPIAAKSTLKRQQNIVTHHNSSNLLTHSVGELPFQNKCIQKNLIYQSSHKSISKFETTVNFNEEKKRNGEYYGGETSFFSRKRHKSAEQTMRKGSKDKKKG